MVVVHGCGGGGSCCLTLSQDLSISTHNKTRRDIVPQYVYCSPSNSQLQTTKDS
jgi:hypothetical protein